MTYSPRPNPSGDDLVSSRDPIRTNFEIIQDRFAENHRDFNDGTGLHTRVDLIEQTTFPSTAANESWASSREYNTRTELVWRPESQAAGEQAIGADQFVLSAMPIRAAGTFVNDNVDGGAQTLLGRSFNITSVTRVTNLQYDVIMTLPTQSVNYFVIGVSSSLSGASQGTVAISNIVAATTTTFSFRPGNSNINTNINFIVFGG